VRPEGQGEGKGGGPPGRLEDREGVVCAEEGDNEAARGIVGVGRLEACQEAEHLVVEAQHLREVWEREGGGKRMRQHLSNTHATPRHQQQRGGGGEGYAADLS